MIEAVVSGGGAVAVFGLARSGLAAARALAAGGADVRAWDDDPARRAAAASAGIPLADLYAADWGEIDALVLSPGVPLRFPEPHEVVRLAQVRGAEILGDVELFARARLPARVVAITGTNGKSTTTALVLALLRACGFEAVLGANFGEPVLALPMLEAEGIYVLELSSYQIALTTSLAADVAVLLNLSPDHLARHGSMAGYIAAKKRLFEMQTVDGAAIIGVDDADSRAVFAHLAALGRDVTPVSGSTAVDGGIYVERGVLYDARDGAPRAIVDLAAARLRGEHNHQNAAAAFAAATALGCDEVRAAAALLAFPGLAHRMEAVAKIGGVQFINDSKATNVDAAARALGSFDNIYWIAGGRPKEQGIAALAHLFPRIRHAFLIGEAEDAFADALAGQVAVTRAGTLPRAVSLAFAAARDSGVADAVVLLSPACASFDQFTDFEARGDAFRDLARSLEAA